MSLIYNSTVKSAYSIPGYFCCRRSCRTSFRNSKLKLHWKWDPCRAVICLAFMFTLYNIFLKMFTFSSKMNNILGGHLYIKIPKRTNTDISLHCLSFRHMITSTHAHQITRTNAYKTCMSLRFSLSLIKKEYYI